MDISNLLFSGAQAQQSGASQATDAGFDFFDLLDVVNPLQHIPVIGDIYRGITDDEIGGFASVVGSTLFTGPIGGGIALANEIVKDENGKGLVAQAFDAITGSNTSPTEYALAADKYNNIETSTGKDSQKMKSTTHDWIYGGTHLA